MHSTPLMRCRRASVVVGLALSMAAPASSRAWVPDGVPVSLAAGAQTNPQIVPDGAGGAIMAWADARNGASDVYAQRLSADGSVLWTLDGVPVCTAAGEQFGVQLVGDGAGGAFIAWTDNRNLATTGNDIYAQRLNAAGQIGWAANGIPVCTASGAQLLSGMIYANVGGIILSWEDQRNGPEFDIYAQHMYDFLGGVNVWTANGVAVCTASGNQTLPVITTDGDRGAIVAWQDTRGGVDADIYAQRLRFDNGAAVWTVGGVPVCTLADHQLNPALISDGVLGAIVSWHDDGGGTNQDIYAQRLQGSDGAILWAAGGVAVCTAAGNQSYPVLASDGAGGALLTWNDVRGGGNVYVQRLDASGSVLWAGDGLALTSAGSAGGARVVSDGSGGAIVGWGDSRPGGFADIYAQHVSPAGAVDWLADGVAVCTATGAQLGLTMAPDGTGGAILGWYDERNGFPDVDVFAQQVPSGVLTAVEGEPAMAFGLFPRGPNPCSGQTSFWLELPRPAALTVEVFDLMGRRLRAERFAPGAASRALVFDGRDDAGRPLSSGVYVYRVLDGQRSYARKVVLRR